MNTSTNKLTVFLLELFLLALLIFSIDLLDPFAWKSVPEQNAEQLIQNITAPLRKSIKNDRVLVVLIDDYYFQANPKRNSDGSLTKPSWPIPTNELFLNIIEPILDQEPSSLFLDMSFADSLRETSADSKETKREAMQQLVQRFNELKHDYKSKIFIGDALSNTLASKCKLEKDGIIDKDCFYASNVLATDFLKDYDHEFINIVNISKPFGQTNYPLGDLKTFTNQWIFSSPALAIYDDVSNEKLPSIKEELRRVNIQNLDPIQQGYVLYTDNSNGAFLNQVLQNQWGMYQSKEMGDIYQALENISKPSCAVKILDKKDDEESTTPQKIGDVIRGALKSLNKHLSFEEKQPCIYINHISAAYLKDIQMFQLEYLKKQKLSNAINKMIKGNVVMIGANILQTKDTTISPISGPIPAVFEHAVALENLLSMNDKYVKKTDSKWLVFLVSILSAFLTIKGHSLFKKVLMGKTDHLNTPTLNKVFIKIRSKPAFLSITLFVLLIIAILLLLLLVMFVVIYLFGQANIPLGLLFITLIGLFIGCLDDIAEWLAAILSRKLSSKPTNL